MANDFIKIFSVMGLAFFHAILPSHWLPLSIMAQKHQWRYSTLFRYITGTVGIHAMSTFFFAWVFVQVGDILGLGEYLEQSSKWGTVLLGLFYLLSSKGKCEHDHTIFHFPKAENYLLLFSMSAFSPCVELVPYLVYWGISPVLRFVCAICYVLTTVFVITNMCLLFMKGYGAIRLNFIEKNESRVMGTVLIFVGFLMLNF